MAEGKVNDRPSLEANLEPVDVEVVAPTSVVVSVRLDASVARRLAKIAASEGRRMSDVLRDAAEQYVGAFTTSSSSFAVMTAIYTLRVGDLFPMTYGIWRADPQIDLRHVAFWGVPPSTLALLT